MIVEDLNHRDGEGKYAKKHRFSIYVDLFSDGLEDGEIATALGVSIKTVQRKRKEYIARYVNKEPELELVVEKPIYNPNNFDANSLAVVDFDGKVDYMMMQKSYFEALKNHNDIVAEQIRGSILLSMQEHGDIVDFLSKATPEMVSVLKGMIQNARY